MGLIKCEWILLITVAVLLLAPYSSDSFAVTTPNEWGDEALVQRWAKFAVEEFNKQRHRNLKLIRYEKIETSYAKSAVVHIIFKIIARDADNNNYVQKYKAMVMRGTLGDNHLRLKYFKLAKLR
ncbi:hypothetical protein ACP275_08G159400 [Erythranthe tilingii]